LPSKEKDKLIFRLLKKDVILANRLLFELVSSESVEEKREKVKQQLNNLIERASVHFLSPGYLLADVRGMSGIINEHVAVTKDKIGEIRLNLFILNEVLSRNNKAIYLAGYERSYTFYVATVAKIFKILLLLKKLHEDYLIDFEDDLKKLGVLVGNNPLLMKTATYNGLDVNWLIELNIPNDLEYIYKDLKNRGF